MRIVDPLIHELEQEAQATKRMLERVPGDKLGWRPHEKSFSLGQLAMHVATIPASVSNLLAQSTIEMPGEFKQEPASSADQLVPALEESVASAKSVLNDLDDESAMSPWKATKDGQVVMEMPKVAFARAIMLNHWYHHRGQLAVYLRMNDIAVPSTYGPSADENPFAM